LARDETFCAQWNGYGDSKGAVTGITIDVGPGGNPSVTVNIESNAGLIFGNIVRSGGIAISAEATAEIVDGP